MGVWLRQGQRQELALLLGRVLTMALADLYDSAARKVHCALTRHRWGITKRTRLGDLIVSPAVMCIRCGHLKALQELPAGHPDATAPPVSSSQAAWLDYVDDSLFPVEAS